MTTHPAGNPQPYPPQPGVHNPYAQQQPQPPQHQQQG